MARFLILLALAVLASCTAEAAGSADEDSAPGTAEMLVAGGCFWCVEADLEKVEGVKDVVSGYAGGKNVNPTYKTYSKGGHREVAQVAYDPAVVSFEELAAFFIRTIDVTDEGGQFCDRGFGYSTALYHSNEEERRILEKVIREGEAELGKTIVTPIVPKPVFYPAEDFHQDYYKKNRFRYGAYRRACGRDRTVRFVWGQSAPERLGK